MIYAQSPFDLFSLSLLNQGIFVLVKKIGSKGGWLWSSIAFLSSATGSRGWGAFTHLLLFSMEKIEKSKKNKRN